MDNNWKKLRFNSIQYRIKTSNFKYLQFQLWLIKSEETWYICLEFSSYTQDNKTPIQFMHF